jgi:hypothetical protein
VNVRTTTPSRLPLVALTLAAVAVTGAGCTSPTKGPQFTSAALAKADCPPLLAAPPEDERPPADLPLPGHDDTPYAYLAEGDTHEYYYAFDGGPQDLIKLRDEYDSVLTAHGMHVHNVGGTRGALAYSSFDGPHAGKTQWRNLCAGKVRLQLRIDK